MTATRSRTSTASTAATKASEAPADVPAVEEEASTAPASAAAKKAAKGGGKGLGKTNPKAKAKMRARKAAAAGGAAEKGAESNGAAAPAGKQGSKQQLVRDSFTIPKNEYHALDQLKKRAMGLQHDVRKGELLRAGLLALAGLPDPAFLKALKAVPTLKTGRPKGGKAGAAAGAESDDE